MEEVRRSRGDGGHGAGDAVPDVTQEHRQLQDMFVRVWVWRLSRPQEPVGKHSLSVLYQVWSGSCSHHKLETRNLTEMFSTDKISMIGFTIHVLTLLSSSLQNF